MSESRDIAPPTHPLKEIRGALVECEEYFDDSLTDSTHKNIVKALTQLDTLISDYVLVKRADVPEGLGEELNGFEQTKWVGPNREEIFVNACTALHNAMEEDK